MIFENIKGNYKEINGIYINVGGIDKTINNKFEIVDGINKQTYKLWPDIYWVYKETTSGKVGCSSVNTAVYTISLNVDSKVLKHYKKMYLTFNFTALTRATSSCHLWNAELGGLFDRPTLNTKYFSKHYQNSTPHSITLYYQGYGATTKGNWTCRYDNINLYLFN